MTPTEKELEAESERRYPYLQSPAFNCCANMGRKGFREGAAFGSAQTEREILGLLREDEYPGSERHAVADWLEKKLQEERMREK